MSYWTIYHPEIIKLDCAATLAYMELRKDHEAFSPALTVLQLKAGALQQKLIRPIGKRYFDAQWGWSYGHIGLLQMAIRWFRKTEPETELIFQNNHRLANTHFFDILRPYLTVVDELPPELHREAQNNAVYFACPDGKLTIHNFYKKVAKETERLPLPMPDVTEILKLLKVERPYTAFHARNFDHEPYRNTSLEDCEKAIGDNLNVINISLDAHPINDIIPNVKMLSQPDIASFQLSAACDRFIGCNSGPWVVANAFGKPVELINDHLHKAWIYPEEIQE